LPLGLILTWVFSGEGRGFKPQTFLKNVNGVEYIIYCLHLTVLENSKNMYYPFYNMML